MQIIIDLKAYYDWEETDSKPDDGEVLALRAKPGNNGKWLIRVLKEQPTYTEVNMHESEIQNLMAHYERIGSPKSREKTVAGYLEDTIMKHHAHVDHWVNITVHDEPAVEKFLNLYFNLGE